MDTNSGIKEKHCIPLEEEFTVNRDRMKLFGYNVARPEFFNPLLESFRKLGQVNPIVLYKYTRFTTPSTKLKLLDYEDDGDDLVIFAGNNKLACIDKLHIPIVKLIVFTNKSNLNKITQWQRDWYGKIK